MENHYKWCETVLENEYIYIILHQTSVYGYIRLTKNESSFKENRFVNPSKN